MSDETSAPADSGSDGGGDSSSPATSSSPDSSAGSYGAIADAAAREAAADALDSEGKPRAKREPAQQGKPTKFMRRMRDDKGEVKEEEWDAERIQKFLDDDDDDEFELDGEKVRIPRWEQRRLVRPAAASMRRMQQAAELRKQLEADRARLKQDLLGFADDTLGHEEADETTLDPEIRGLLNGMRPTKAQAAYLQAARKVYELAQLRKTDPDKYLAEQKRVIDARMAARTKMEAEQRANSERVERWGREIPAALQQAGLDDTPENRMRLANVHQPAIAAGYDMPFTEAAYMVRQQQQKEVRSVISKMDGPTLHKFLGPELTKRLREVDLKKVKAETQQAAAPQAQPRQQQNGQPAKKRSVWSV
jgi:hypothetical protein